MGCHFANEDTLLVNLGKILYCWKNIQNALATTLAWRYQPSAKVTSISPVLLHHPKSSSNDLIVLGTDHGQLIVLNFQKITKERAFSSQHRPIVLQEWTPHRKSPAGGSRILQLYARATSSTRNSKNNHTALGRVEFSWVTAQGWLLSTNLSVLPNTTSGNRAATTDTVVHTPPRVEVYNADGERIEVSGQHKTYSSPKDPVVAYHCNNNGWYFSHVPQTTKILPHHNKYVLQSNITDIQTSSSEKSKALLFWNNSKVQKMKLPSGINHTPSVVAVHPDGEWMALGVNHRLVVMTVARR